MHDLKGSEKIHIGHCRTAVVSGLLSLLGTGYQKNLARTFCRYVI
jgi:hypothetical protein